MLKSKESQVGILKEALTYLIEASQDLILYGDKQVKLNLYNWSLEGDDYVEVCFAGLYILVSQSRLVHTIPWIERSAKDFQDIILFLNSMRLESHELDLIERPVEKKEYQHRFTDIPDLIAYVIEVIRLNES